MLAISPPFQPRNEAGAGTLPRMSIMHRQVPPQGNSAYVITPPRACESAKSTSGRWAQLGSNQ